MISYWGRFFSDLGRFFLKNVPKRPGPNGTFFAKGTVPNQKNVSLEYFLLIEMLRI